MKKILLATDFATNTDRATERALKLAKETGAALHIVHVMPAYKAKKLKNSLQQEMADLIEAYVYDYKDSEDVAITINILNGRTAFAEILGYAQKIKAELIVMGMHSKAKFQDLFVGTTIERIARKGAIPLLMVKNKPTGSYQSILSPVDFSPGSRAALRLAMELVPHGVFEVIHAYNIPIAYPTTAEYALQAYAQTEKTQQKHMISFMNTELSHFKKEHNGQTKRLSQKLVQGSAYETIIKEAKKEKVDLITIGAHGRSVLTPSKLGGVAADILTNPPCDILVVKG